MVNLLTKSATAKLRTMYYTRVVTIFFLLVAFAGAGSVALLLPSYFLIHAEADDAARFVAALTDIADQRAKGQAAETLAVFTDSVHLLGSSSHEPQLGKILLLMTGVLPKGVSLDAIDATTQEDGTIKVVVNGTASTRTLLISYADSLKAVRDLSGVTLPVSDLVAEVNNSFSIVATYTPPKAP